MSAEHEREGEMVPSKEATKARHVVKILASEYDSLLEIKEAAAAHQQTMQQLQARLDDVNVKDSVKTREINLLVDENKRLHARVKELEDREWVAALFMDDVDNTAQVQAIQGLQAEVSDEERWMREVLTDFRIPFDDHKVGRRYAMSCWMQELQAEVERLKTISLCRCGDHFTAEDPGTCGNCLATYYQDRVKTGTVMAKVDR